jgi:hypothetical protein
MHTAMLSDRQHSLASYQTISDLHQMLEQHFSPRKRQVPLTLHWTHKGLGGEQLLQRQSHPICKIHQLAIGLQQLD